MEEPLLTEPLSV